MYQAAYSFSIHSSVSINTGLSPIVSVSSAYTMMIEVLSSFTLYKRQGAVLYSFNVD